MKNNWLYKKRSRKELTITLRGVIDIALSNYSDITTKDGVMLMKGWYAAAAVYTPLVWQ